ncbi:MAG TPA: undecaprenyldiphospho-muramoylpentapeptide beta-N-acetylglucosaminyltransferase [Solirubrobacteraceae bacterium]|nr:undecaprenyldiphospho-muramoylpentapeptide beta-N-acetylglucosaminyltransferase [Solirubrobacteraceae bacterium]
MTSPLIVIGAGGTAGHVVPALAVADALRAEGARVVFIGGRRAEQTLVPAAGYELRTIDVVSLPRRDPVKALNAGLTDAGALRACRRIIRELKPDAVFGAGGYVAGPVGLAAVVARIPLVLLESDSHLGLTNRLLARVARRVCLAFPLQGREPPRYLVTGRPIPPPATDRAAARERFGLGPDDRVVLVFGGSLGARSINQAAVEAFAGADFRVLHAAGERDFADLQAPGPHYDLRSYIDDFNQALLASDLVVARSGGSVFEVAAHGKPMILIPYPHATADHQTANARYMERAGAAVVIPDGELSAARLAEAARELLGRPETLATMAAAAATVARPQAASEVARAILAQAR